MHNGISSRFSVWLRWTLATSLSSMAGFLLAILLLNLTINQYQIDQLTGSLTSLFDILFFVLIGIPIGAGQWMILRSLHKRANWWIIATALGFTASFYVVFSSFPFVPEKIQPYYWFFSSVLAGLFIGALQWIALHRTLKGAVVWILVSELSWGIAMSLFERLDGSLDMVNLDAVSFVLIFGTLVGFVVGGISGAFVTRHLVRGYGKEIVHAD